MSPIIHSKVSAIADGADTDLIRPIDWNDAHEGTLSFGWGDVKGVKELGTIYQNGNNPRIIQFTGKKNMLADTGFGGYIASDGPTSPPAEWLAGQTCFNDLNIATDYYFSATILVPPGFYYRINGIVADEVVLSWIESDIGIL